MCGKECGKTWCSEIGSITKGVNSFTVKIEAGVPSDAQETRIRQVISESFNGDCSWVTSSPIGS